MDNLARKIENIPLRRDVEQEVGRVTGVEGALLAVSVDGAAHTAARAVSCLVAPEPGDFVLLAVVSGSTPTRRFVLAVLEREAGAAATVAVDGDLSFKVPHGRFTVAAQDGIDLIAAREMSVVSGRLNVNAVDGNVVFQELSYLGKLVRSEVERVKSFAQTVDVVMDRFTQQVKRSYRTVEELDQVRADSIDYVAKKTLSLRGDNTLMTAKQLVKVDGEQIHLG